MEAICSHSNYRFLCKDCLKFLCVRCKMEHNHTKVIDISFLNSFVKFEVENLKIILNELEIFQNFEEKVGLKSFIYKLRDFYSTLIEEKLNLNSITKPQKISIRDLVFNAKILLGEETNLKINSNQAYLDFYIKFQETNKICSTLNSIIEKINKSFENFSEAVDDLGKYNQIKVTRNEENLIKNHSELIDNISKDKKEQNDKTSELLQRVKLLESENDKIMEINRKLTEDINNLNLLISNKFYNVEGDKLDKENSDTKNVKKFLDFYKSDINTIFEEIKVKFFANNVQQNQLDDFDKLDMKTLIRTNFDSLFSAFNSEDVKILKVDSKEFKNYLVETKLLEDICDSTVYKNTIEKIKILLADEIIDTIYESRDVILEQLRNSIFPYYLKNSKKIKQLKTIDLKNSQIEDKDMIKICDILNCTKITDVYLHNNSITDAGIIQFFENLKENKIKSLYLINNSITDKTIKELLTIITNNSKVFANLKILSFEKNKISGSKVSLTLKEIKKILKTTIYV